jgi:hypothetical protein
MILGNESNTSQQMEEYTYILYMFCIYFKMWTARNIIISITSE